MNAKKNRCWVMTLSIATLALTVASAAPLVAQNRAEQPAGIPEDWTHHHLVFGDAGTEEQAIDGGTHESWLKTINDPRYQLQQAKRLAAANATAPERNVPTPASASQLDFGDSRDGYAASAPNDNANLDGSLPRGLSRAPVRRTSQMDGDADSQDILIVGKRWWTVGGSPRTSKDWSETLGSGGTLGLGNYPAKYSFTTTGSTGSCSDWIAYSTSLAGSSSQATIIAFSNLYSGTCTGTVPNTHWAFNTGTGSTIVTSAALSLDGTQLVFVQSSSTGVASLVILKWSASGTVAAPATPSNQSSGSAYRTCTAPCMYTIGFHGSANDTGSSVWYDYNLDTVWVGDDNGSLHKFTGVFVGTPEEVTTGGWPVSVSASPLNGPVRDTTTGNVFVGDYNLSTTSACTPSSSNANSPCGFLYSYNYSTGALIAKSAQLDFNFGIVDTPIVDPVAGRIYVAVGSDSEAGSATACGTDTPCAGIFQFPTNFSSGAAGTEATIGPGYQFMMAGTFDNAYFTSANSASPSGHIYVVGNTGPANNTLYQITVTNNTMSTTSVSGPVVAQNYTNGYYASGLGVTEFYNGSTDYVFLSTIAFSNYSGCGATASVSTGCVIGFNVTSGSISSATAPAGSSSATGGASGIIVDNAGAAAGESNIYFSALANQTCTTSGGTSGCAIQISQSSP